MAYAHHDESSFEACDDRHCTNDFLLSDEQAVAQLAGAACRRLGGPADIANDIAQNVRISAWKRARSSPMLLRQGFLSRAARWAVSNELRYRERWIVGGSLNVEPLDPSHENALPYEALNTDAFARNEVARWTKNISKRLRIVYRGLYRLGMSQRRLARRMRVSQPRVAQLHAELLRAGRRGLAHLL